MKRTLQIGLCAALLSVFNHAAGEELVAEFSGDKSTVTEEFEVEAPWVIDWLVTSEYRTGASIEVSLVDANLGSHLGYVVSTTGTGDGVKLFDQGGRFYIRVNATLMHWLLRVKALSEEEAEGYTPKESASE
jgi:hypothetical protein